MDLLMINKKRKSGFTLTEVLISAGILSIGFMLIAGAFPVGIKLTSMATERTIGSITAQEAVAKMKIYGLSVAPDTLPSNQCFDYEAIANLDFKAAPFEQYYPSTNLVDPAEKKYHWSALCRYDPVENEIQVTVFVSRLGGVGVEYPDPTNPSTTIDVPKPVMVSDVKTASANSLDLSTASVDTTYFSEGSVIVDNRNGNLYTILERTDNGDTAVLDRDWLPNDATQYDIWVIPSAIKPGTTNLGGRWPCVWVFQDTIKF